MDAFDAGWGDDYFLIGKFVGWEVGCDKRGFQVLDRKTARILVAQRLGNTWASKFDG